MKYSLCTLFIMLVVNVLAGALLKCYEWSNVGCTSAVMVCNFLLWIAVQSSKMKEAFKISLSFIFPVLEVAELVLAVLAPAQVEDNVYLVSVVSLMAIQLLLYLCLNLVSQKS